MLKKVTTYAELLPSDLLEELDGIAHSTQHEAIPYIGRTNASWPIEIRRQSAPVIIRDIVPRTELYGKLTEVIQGRTGWKVARLMMYFWTRLSYIPWHNDGHVHAGLTLYLNEFWHDDWGGLFMYVSGAEIHAIKPVRNLAVLQEGNVRHSVSTINMDADTRVTVQAFFQEKLS